MPNMFRCTLASGGGDGADLIVTCSSHFAGSVITCTDGSSYTKTQTCPSSSPYEVTFESIPTGTYTISGVVSGTTYSITKTILDFDAFLTDIPDGSTVTPTDDIQTWLFCAGIFDKAYTTISEVLNDATTVTTLIASNNAVDYMVRSTTWASDVCADSSAMTKIGANNYCSDALLDDNTWLNAIGNSTYIESVLNVKVPTMTSATAPSGEVLKSSNSWDNSSNAPWKAFDGNDTTYAMMYGTGDATSYIGYKFTSAKKIKVAKLKLGNNQGTSAQSRTFTLRGSSDNSTWTNLGSDTRNYSTSITNNFNILNTANNNEYQYFSIYCDQPIYVSGFRIIFYTIQFYGRTDV